MISMFACALDLLSYGYSPIPVSDEDGLPHVKQWNRHRDEPMDPQLLEWWFTTRPQHGLAVLGGYNGLVPIDVDTDDAGVLRAVSSVLPEASVIRRGSKGFMAFYRDPAGGIADMRRKNFV